MMQYWLIKSEPYVYSFEQLVKEGRTMWEGVRNYSARNNLRAMKEGDLLLYYHSNKGLEIVGLAKVIRTHYPDPTAKKGDWSAVDIVPIQALQQPVTLKEIKAEPALAEMELVRQSRLSVSKVRPQEFEKILEMAQTERPV